MIEGIVGLPGNGKTLLACKMLHEAAAKGKRCFANFTSPAGVWERVVWEDIIKMENAFVLIDEAHMWFPSREWSRQGQDVLGIFQQHRKAGLDLVWIAQHENRVDVALRELTAYLHFCRKIGPIVIDLVYEACGKQKTRSEWFYGPHYYGLYWTEERVLGRGEKTSSPIVGVEPNFARYEDPLFDHVTIAKREKGSIAEKAPERTFYVSPWGGGMVEYED